MKFKVDYLPTLVENEKLLQFLSNSKKNFFRQLCLYFQTTYLLLHSFIHSETVTTCCCLLGRPFDYSHSELIANDVYWWRTLLLSRNARKSWFLHEKWKLRLRFIETFLRSILSPEKITNLDFLTDSRQRSVNMSSDWTLKRYAWWLERKPFNVSVVKSQQDTQKATSIATPDRAIPKHDDFMLK